ADRFLYYVMPYVEGESLRERLEREGQLPLDEALRITRAIATALDFAHGRGVIHRDIKPENIMLHQGEPMVADFGIALAVSMAGRERLTETGLSLGTPAYMSPEQAPSPGWMVAATSTVWLRCCTRCWAGSRRTPSPLRKRLSPSVSASRCPISGPCGLSHLTWKQP